MYFKKHEKYSINNASWGKNYEINKERKKIHERSVRDLGTQRIILLGLPVTMKSSMVISISMYVDGSSSTCQFSAFPSNYLALHTLSSNDLVLHGNSDIHSHGPITDLALAGATFHHNLNFKNTIFWTLLPTFPLSLHTHIRKGLFFKYHQLNCQSEVAMSLFFFFPAIFLLFFFFFIYFY